MTESVKRQYTSTLRAEQARATREAILAAAETSFTEVGYAATTVGRLAQRAGVAPQTVYAAFASKAGVLAALRDLRLAGGDEPVAVQDRVEWQQMLTADKPAERMRRLAALARQINQRAARLNRMVHQSSGTDTELAALSAREAAERRASLTGVVAGVRPGQRREQLLDALAALVSPDLYALLVLDSGWQPQTYEVWLFRQLLATWTSEPD
jgi:AcrR family transcriptional regulator